MPLTYGRTPLQLESTYHNLMVILDNYNTTEVNVRRYQNNGEQYKNNPNAGNKDALVQKDLLVGRMSYEASKMRARAAALAQGKKPAGEPSVYESDFGLKIVGELSHLTIPEIMLKYQSRMMEVHCGKGSPYEIAICLHLVAIFGLYDKKKFGADSAAGVRDYCDKYIGLDCNGFVGNFAQQARLGKVPNSEIPTYARKGHRRTTLESVEPWDVLVWPDDSHIAVIHSIDRSGTTPDGKAYRDCTIVESTGANPSGGTGTANGGLQHSTYTLRSVGPDELFKVERPKGKGLVNVYIGPIA